MDKSTILKIGVVLLVLAFLFEIFGFNSPYNKGNGPEVSPEPSIDLTGPVPVNGNAEAIAQVVAYNDGIVTIAYSHVAEDAALAAKLNQMKSEGRVSYTTSASPDVVNVVLPEKGNAVSAVARELLAEFPLYAYSARASVLLPENASFATPTADVSARLGGRATIAMEPLLDIGDNVSVGVTATLENGIAQDVIASAAQQEGRIAASGNVTEVSPNFILEANYDWSERGEQTGEAIAARIAERYPNASVDYMPYSAIVFANSSDAQGFVAANLSYVFLLSDSIVLVHENFTNRSAVEEDVQRLVGEVEFLLPPSTASINATGEYDEEFIAQALGTQYFQAARPGRIALPSTFQWNGMRYYYGGNLTIERNLPVNSTAGGNVTVIVQIVTNGPRITSVS